MKYDSLHFLIILKDFEVNFIKRYTIYIIKQL
jgi:hypothetical protein